MGTDTQSYTELKKRFEGLNPHVLLSYLVLWQINSLSLLILEWLKNCYVVFQRTSQNATLRSFVRRDKKAKTHLYLVILVQLAPFLFHEWIGKLHFVVIHKAGETNHHSDLFVIFWYQLKFGWSFK
jgi:hypothetical protein